MFKKNTVGTPEEYIAQLLEPRRSEIQVLHDLIHRAVPELAPHRESGGIGYGRYHYKYASGRQGDAPWVGLASHKQYISVYLMGTVNGEYVAEAARAKFPKANVGKSRIRFKRTADVDLNTLRALVRESADSMGDLKYPRGGTQEVEKPKPAKKT